MFFKSIDFVSGSGAVCVSHFDGSGLEAAVTNMIKMVTDLSKNKISQGRYKTNIYIYKCI